MFFDRFDSIKKVEAGVKDGFSKIKEELDNHLDSINQNTDEIQAVYDYLSQLEAKLDKFSERVDYMEMLLNPSMDILSRDVSLTQKEKQVFMVLYVSGNVTTKEIAGRLGMTESMVLNCIYGMVGKGVPLIREKVQDGLRVCLNHKFRELQAKKNVLNIDLNLDDIEVSRLTSFI